MVNLRFIIYEPHIDNTYSRYWYILSMVELYRNDEQISPLNVLHQTHNGWWDPLSPLWSGQDQCSWFHSGQMEQESMFSLVYPVEPTVLSQQGQALSALPYLQYSSMLRSLALTGHYGLGL